MEVSRRILDDIAGFIFVEDEPKKADIIFVPGSASPEPAERAAELYRQGFAPFVLPAGRFSYKRDRFDGPETKRDVYCGDYSTEWEFLRDVLLGGGVPEQAILREDRSTHTVDNAFLSREAVRGLGLAIHTAILCCRSFHARRCLMTYGWAFPDVEFAVCPVDVQGIGRLCWHETACGREKVLSEVSKCGSYFMDVAGIWSRGDRCPTSSL
jgi:uncharacterized SAM-binding protein YcdF (DUF218 family)